MLRNPAILISRSFSSLNRNCMFFMVFKTWPLHSGSLCALRHRKAPRFRGCAASITRLCKGQDLFSCGPRVDFRGTLGEVSTKIGHSHGWASGGPARAVVLGRSWLHSQGVGRVGFVSSVKQSVGFAAAAHSLCLTWEQMVGHEG